MTNRPPPLPVRTPAPAPLSAYLPSLRSRELDAYPHNVTENRDRTVDIPRQSTGDRAGLAGSQVRHHDEAPTEACILELITNRLNIDVVDVNLDLVETGMIDSLALVTLITALEEKFECELPLDDFDLENFRSARRITGYLATSGVLETRGTS
jgi:acyl carrier protein